MSPIAETYFQDIFRTTSPMAINHVAQAVETKVIPRMNKELLKPFTGVEIREALFQMHPTKSPGPDGMHALFYKKKKKNLAYCWL